MRIFLSVFAALLACTLSAATSATAQERGQPNLVLTFYAGVGSGHQLWSVGRQTLVYEGSTANPPDTVALNRQLSSALILGGVFQLFPRSGLFGFSVDIGFRSIGLDDTCQPVLLQADPTPGNSNQILCDNITAYRHPGGSVISLGVTGIFRVAPAGVITPYVRVGGNLSFLSVSTVDLAAADAVGDVQRSVIIDTSPRRNSFGMMAAGGLTLGFAPGYRARIEVRDDIATFEYVDGPASPVALAPTSVSLFHNLGLVIGFDVLLEQKRPRRY